MTKLWRCESHVTFCDSQWKFKSDSLQINRCIKITHFSGKVQSRHLLTSQRKSEKVFFFNFRTCQRKHPRESVSDLFLQWHQPAGRGKPHCSRKEATRSSSSKKKGGRENWSCWGCDVTRIAILLFSWIWVGIEFLKVAVFQQNVSQGEVWLKIWMDQSWCRPFFSKIGQKIGLSLWKLS